MPAVCLMQTMTDLCRCSQDCVRCFHEVQAGRYLTGSLAAACSSSSSSLKPKRAPKRMALSTRSGSAHKTHSQALHVRLKSTPPHLKRSITACLCFARQTAV